MGTSWGAAIDYLVAGLTPILQAIEPTVQVVDGWPEKTSETMVFLGRAAEDSGGAGDSALEYAELGAGRIEESYTIPGYVDVFRPGPDQKTARDAAISLYNPIVAFVHADPMLGGLLQRGRIGLVSRLSARQTQDDQDTAGGGYLRALIGFELAVKNAYIP